MRAAIEASNAMGVSVGLVCKSLLGKAHTVMAEGGVAAALGNVEPTRQLEGPLPRHDEGRPLPQSVAHGAAPRAGSARSRAASSRPGARSSIARRTGSILQRNFGGHTYPRLAHVGDRTGLEMIRTLQQHGVHLGIKVYMECTITRLLVDGDRVSGAFGYWRESGKFVMFGAKAIVLATGGIGRMFKINSNSWECTGDGQALAYLAGAELMDCEFMQFHPTGMVWPPTVRGTLITEGVRGEGGTLRNKDGKRIMFDYIPALYANETADTEAEADRLARRVDQGHVHREAHARPPPARHRRARHPHRGEGRSRLSARRRVPRHRDASLRRGHQEEAPGDVPPVQGAR